MRRGTIALSWGSWGGPWCALGKSPEPRSWCLCLGWIALDYYSEGFHELKQARSITVNLGPPWGP